jgi:D-alanine-D-alanine ligase
VIPADIAPDASHRLRAAAVAVYQALGCQGLSRVDFFLTGDDQVVFNEINTLPGFTTISMYPKLWGATGIGYTDLLTRLVELALERGCRIP